MHQVPICADQVLGILNIVVEGEETDQGKGSRLEWMMYNNKDEIKEEEERKTEEIKRRKMRIVRRLRRENKRNRKREEDIKKMGT
jgi:hypothetical protein